MKKIALVGTLDTKGPDNQYLAEQLRENGVETILIDVGMRGEPCCVPDIPAEDVAQAAGYKFSELKKLDHARGLEVMAGGAALLVSDLCAGRKICGAMAMGGSQGTYIAGAVMRALPIGFPKLIISTVATIDRAQHLLRGINDTMVINSLVDIAGVNPLSAMVMRRSADAMCGMLGDGMNFMKSGRSCIGMTMWGVTTPCVMQIKDILESNGLEVMVFHATGMGGPIMEKLAAQGYLDGIIDITLPELSNPIAGGNYPDNPDRVTLGGKKGIPYIASVGGMDMIEPDTPMPDKFKNRKQYWHSENLVFVRSSPQENAVFGQCLSEKLEAMGDSAVVVLPLKGISAVDQEGNDFYDAEADRNLFDALTKQEEREYEVMEIDAHINDFKFAYAVAQKMIHMLRRMN